MFLPWFTRETLLTSILDGRNRKNIQHSAPDLMATSTPPHTPRTPGSEPGYGPVRPSDHSPIDPLRERRPPALPYGDQGLAPLDFRYGWNLNDVKHQQKAMEVL